MENKVNNSVQKKILKNRHVFKTRYDLCNRNESKNEKTCQKGTHIRKNWLYYQKCGWYHII